MILARKSDDTIVLEGKRLIVDAMKAGFYPDVFVFSRLNTLLDIPFDKSRDIDIYQIPYRSIKLWSELKAQPGLMGILLPCLVDVRCKQVAVHCSVSEPVNNRVAAPIFRVHREAGLPAHHAGAG